MKLTIEKNGRSEVITIMDARQGDILPGQFRNFRGEKRRFNDEGKRNFNLALNLPEEALQDLAATGLKIKELAGNEEYGDEPTRFVKVNVAFGGRVDPELYLCCGRNKPKLLTQNELGLLDGARFTNVDLSIRTYHRDESTCTLYLQKGYFTIEQDPISAKYENLNYDLLDLEGEEPLPFNED